jgi:hypothetical protein
MCVPPEKILCEREEEDISEETNKPLCFIIVNNIFFTLNICFFNLRLFYK